MDPRQKWVERCISLVYPGTMCVLVPEPGENSSVHCIPKPPPIPKRGGFGPNGPARQGQELPRDSFCTPVTLFQEQLVSLMQRYKHALSFWLHVGRSTTNSHTILRHVACHLHPGFPFFSCPLSCAVFFNVSHPHIILSRLLNVQNVYGFSKDGFAIRIVHDVPHDPSWTIVIQLLQFSTIGLGSFL